MICPKCGKSAQLVNCVRKATTAVGVGAGGYLAATTSGATGAAIGSFICPGVGSIVGGVLGFLLGAAAGGAAGHSVGKFVDDGIIRKYRCESCGCEWRA